MGAVSGIETASCPSNASSQGLWSRWRARAKALSDRDRTGVWRKEGPLLILNMEDLAQRLDKKSGAPQSRGIAQERDTQHRAAHSNRGHRGGNRIARREKERDTRMRAEWKRQVTLTLEAALNSLESGSEPRKEVTINRLQCWQQRGCISVDSVNENLNSQEMPQTVRETVNLSGLTVDSTKNEGKGQKRIEEDGILMVVTTKVYGKEFKTLIDSGATRCFITPECCLRGGLVVSTHNTFLELGTGEKALSRGLVRQTPISVAGVMRKVDLTVSKLLHGVDIVLGINWLESVNPLIDWCSGKMYLPNAVHTAFLKGSWLEQQHKIGTVKIISTHEGLEEIKNEDMKNQLAIIKSPKFWNEVYTGNSWTNSTKGGVKTACNDKEKNSKLFIRDDQDFGHLYIKKMRNSATIPKRSTEGAAGYDLSAAEEATVPAQGKSVVKTGLSMAIPEGCYGRIAPRSGLAVKRHIDIGAGVIDQDYRGEVGVVMFNHSNEDFHVKMGDRIAQLILEKITTPNVQEVKELDSTVRGSKGYGSTGMNQSEKGQDKDPSRVSILSRVQGKPKIKRTTHAQQKRQFISAKQMQKLMKKKEQVYLCIIREDEDTQRTRRTRGKRRNSIALGAAKAQVSPGMTKKVKREMSKEIGPKKKFLTVQEREKEVIENAAVEHRDELQKVIAEYRDVFRDKLPEGPPPSRSVTHSIEVLPGSEPTYRTPYRLRPTEQDELEEQIRDLLAQGFIRPSQSPYGAPILFVPKKDGR